MKCFCFCMHMHLDVIIWLFSGKLSVFDAYNQQNSQPS